jgi:xanthine dehydrogenase accessory factor
VIASMLRDTAAAWLAGQRRAIVVEVVQARGSVPRGSGTRMLVADDACAGTVGGGHLELKAIHAARAMLARRDLSPRQEHYALGPSLGQCCGGAVTLTLAPLDATALIAWPASEPLFHLQLHGAGHVGRAIATLLATLDVQVDWFDERDEEFPATTSLGSPWPAHIRRISADTIEHEVRQAPAGAFYLVLTHEHALDQRITEAILRRDDFAFLGLIGSKTKRTKFVRRLEERGIATAAIERMTCPIGLPGIEGKAPEIIAAAVVAQLLQLALQGAPTRAPADAAGTSGVGPSAGP